MAIKKKWVNIDGWRGYYEPVPPKGFELLVSCSIVNRAGKQLKGILAEWLKKNKIRYKTGYLQTSNVFSSNLYALVETGKIEPKIVKEIKDWFITENNRTFSIFSGASRELDVKEAKEGFDKIVEGAGEAF